MSQQQTDAVGIALIGCGQRGVNAHGRLASESPRLNLVVVCDVDESRARAAGEQLGVPYETDYRRVLDRAGVQAVIVATGVDWHVPIALDAVRAGKHVVVEKPLSDTAAAGRELAHAADDAGVIGMVGYQLRLSSFAEAIKREVEQVQPMQALVTRWRGPFRRQFFIPGFFGGIMDHAAHDIHLALWLMGGAPTGVYASVQRGLILGDETLEFVNILVEFDGGRRSATIIGSMHAIQTPNIVQVVGTRGTVTTMDRKTLQVVRHDGIVEPLPARPAGLEATTVETGGEGGDSTRALLEHLADLITGRTKEQRAATLWEGMHAVSVMEAAVESARAGRRIPIDAG